MSPQTKRFLETIKEKREYVVFLGAEGLKQFIRRMEDNFKLHKQTSMKNYTEADLISFGNYLLSIERVKQYFDKKESFYNVYDADLENWKEENIQKLTTK